MRGKLKGLFFVLKLHVLFPSRLFIFLGHLAKISRFANKHKRITYTDFYAPKFNSQKREELFRYVIKKEELNDVDYLEFGVSSGSSFTWWASELKSPNARLIGFDTFTGLPERWGSVAKGAMSNGNKIPEINDDRCSFHQGLFQQTLVPFLATYPNDKRKILHMNADLYSATLYVLTIITPYLKKGDIIFFDEFNVPMHEFKAFTEWVESFYIDFEVLGSVNNFFQIGVKIM